MGPQDQQHQQQQARRAHHMGEMRRRAAHLTTTGAGSSSMDGNTITQEQAGGYAGFNGIVFGSGGQSDLAGTLGLRMGFDSGSAAAAGGPGAAVHSSGSRGGQQLDWNATALREIANQGRVPDEETRADKYANETRKAIGIHTHNSMIRRNMSLGRRRSSLISNNSVKSPNAEPKSYLRTDGAISGMPASPGNEGSGYNPFVSEKLPKEPVVMDDSEMGPLAASMLAPSETRFDPEPGSRFVLYSPSAGIYESDHLNGLRSNEMTLADIIEASSRLLTLDQLRGERASRQADNRLSQPLSFDSNIGCFWIDVTDPTPEEMASLARVFGIHPLTVEDIMADEDGRDKFETFAGYNFMMYRTIDYGEDAHSTYEFNRGAEGIATASFSIILKQSCVLTFHRAQGIEHIGNVVSRLRELAPFDVSTGVCLFPHVVTPAYVAYALVDDITDTLAPEMRSVELEVDAVDELVLILSTNEQADMLKRIGSARRKILTIWRLLQGKPEVIKAFSKLMERHAAVDDMIRAEIEEAEYMRRMMDPAVNTHSDLPVNAPVAASDGGGGGLSGQSMPPSVLASPQSTLRRSATSSTAIAQMALGVGANSSAGAARRKDVPLWPAYITGAMGSKDARVPSTRPSTADLTSGGGGARGDAEAPVTAEEVSHYLSDVYDHLVSLSGSSSHCDMVLSRAHSNYLARISLGLGESTVETNMFASRWTVIGAILVPLNVVTGLWGMNVKVPGGDREDLRDFFLILAGCMAFVVAVIVWAKYKKIF
ncbi:CorA metal ion transporter [Coemansia erecta]|uniref:CorA metal ion transporter n=1 Tax=Coemansia erecta TaxID=147472 RepID=A0A9W7XZR5_9FUNG|nr:CorA metal ion transporter [Coemansia erecta]